MPCAKISFPVPVAPTKRIVESVFANCLALVTTLSIAALAAGGALDAWLGEADRRALREWIAGQQHRVEHPYTGAAPGGWAWTDLSGGVPDADDTAGALIALRHLGGECDEGVRAGLRWLLAIQNRDGGVPTFCRGWGKLPFDRSSNDLTAHALAAMDAWIDELDDDDSAAAPALPVSRLETVPRTAPPRPRYRPAGQEPAEDEKGVEPFSSGGPRCKRGKG